MRNDHLITTNEDTICAIRHRLKIYLMNGCFISSRKPEDRSKDNYIVFTVIDDCVFSYDCVFY